MTSFPTYPTKPHTRATSSDFLNHIIDIFENYSTSSDNIWTGLQSEDITTLLEFIGSPTEDLCNLEYDHDGVNKTLTKPEKRLVKNIHAWILWENKNRPNIDFGTLTLDDYDNFLLARNQVPTVDVDTTSMAPLQIAIPPPTPTHSQFVSPASLMPSVKLDVKTYPVFNGDNASWSKFKCGVLSIASTHGLDDIFDENTIVPIVGDPDFALYQEKNKFVFSIWISRITSGMALSIVREFEATRDGRGTYLKFLQIYEGNIT